VARRPLAAALRAALAKPDRLPAALEPWADTELTPADADGLCTVLAEQADVRPLLAPAGGPTTPLYHLAALFQNDAADEATRALRKRGMAELARLFDAAMILPDPPAEPLVFVCKMFALYAYRPGVRRIAAGVRRFPDEFQWQIVFALLGDERHPHGPGVVARLRDPLPPGFGGVLLLDVANVLAGRGRLDRHPFDTPAGCARLEAWLADTDPENFSYASSAAAALPYLGAKARAPLASLAMDHSSPDVQLEAAAASARRGGTAGLKLLVRTCADPRHSLAAQGYLTELGRADQIPAAAAEPDFRASAELCRWLAHPHEFGAPPAEIELADTRELDWPPTNDRRRVWLFRYAYADGIAAGLGMVGSLTFALVGEATAGLSAEDAYGLHCCWELEFNGDPRAPKKRNAKAGRKLLGI